MAANRRYTGKKLTRGPNSAIKVGTKKRIATPPNSKNHRLYMNMTNLQQTKKDGTFYKPCLMNYHEILTVKLKKFHF